MKLRIVLAIVIVLLVLSGLVGVKALQIQKLIAAGQSFTPPPETVSTTVVRAEQWQGTISAIGTVVAVQGVTVTPDIPGIVREITFESGAMVASNALLVKLDVSSEIAQLRAVESQVELARLNLGRIRSLRSDNTVSQSDLDTADAALKQAQANADVIQATIEKKTIRAPFAGQLGLRQVNLGQYLEAGRPIVSLQSLAPVYVEFSMPQQELARLKTGMRVRVITDTYPGQLFTGTLTAINPDLDQGTRSVRLQATFDNQEGKLRPGMFTRVEVLLPEEKAVMVIPATSVLSAPYGNSVYLVEASSGKDGKPGLTVRQQFVRTGQARGDLLSVESGLKAGDRIVSAGIFKLRNGMSVVENNNLSPKNDAAPRPTDS
ncbi:MAG: efflux RND transporter periplasmic adaptor subunit [Verrucomicrobiota bacterium]